MCFMCNFQNLGGQICANASCKRDRRLVGVGQCERRRRAIPVRFAPPTPSPDPSAYLRRKAPLPLPPALPPPPLPPPASRRRSDSSDSSPSPKELPPAPTVQIPAEERAEATARQRIVRAAAREQRLGEGRGKRVRADSPSDSPSDSSSASMPTSPTSPLMQGAFFVAPLSLNGDESAPMLEAPVLAVEHGAWEAGASDGEDEVLPGEVVVAAPLELRPPVPSPVIVTLPITAGGAAAHADCGERRALHPKHAFKQQLKECAGDGASRERSRATSPKLLPGPPGALPSAPQSVQ